MFIHAGLDRGRALRASIIAGVSAAGLLGFAAQPALASYKAQVQNGTLQIVGNNASDKLELRADPNNPNVLQLDVGEDGTTNFSFDASTFTAISVQAGGGDDEVRMEGFGTFADKALTIDGGSGDDTLTGGDGADTLIGGSGDDTLIGGDGADTLIGGGGRDTIDGGRGNDVALMGSGADTFTWDPGDGSDTVEGQGGNDALDFNGSNAGENINISANGSRVRLFRDVAAITMDLGGINAINLRTLGGSDTVTVGDLTGTDLKAANIDLGAFDGTGDGQADTVIADGTDAADHAEVSSANGVLSVSGLAAAVNVTGAEPANDTVQISTLGGDDTVDGGVGIANLATVRVDGGEGSDQFTYSGTQSDDTIGIAVAAGAVRTFAQGVDSAPQDVTAVESLLVRDRQGNDTIAGSNGIAGLTNLTIDGGAGDDRLIGGDGADTIIGGGGSDSIDGGRGNDVALMGSGADTFTWDPGDGSDTVEGQGGNDALDFNGSNAGENVNISANGSRVRLFRDVAAITMDLGGINAINLRTLGGSDTVTVGDLTGTDLKAANIDLGAFDGTGDGQADTVIADGTDGPDRVNVSADAAGVHVSGLTPGASITGSEPSLDTLAINTLGGFDKVAVAPNVSQLINPIVDLGADQ